LSRQPNRSANGDVGIYVFGGQTIKVSRDWLPLNIEQPLARNYKEIRWSPGWWGFTSRLMGVSWQWKFIRNSLTIGKQELVGQVPEFSLFTKFSITWNDDLDWCITPRIACDHLGLMFLIT
jgi:hypothetical protein